MSAAAFTIDGPAGRLECLLRRPEGPPRAAAVVCHPHPLYGGTMHNKVVYRVAEALATSGVTALRFNFRGVGLSGGSHDEGRGELDDLGAALDWLEAGHVGLPLLVAGYSFGAWVGMRQAARDARARAWIGLGLATTIHGYEELGAVAGPKLVLQGSADTLGPIAEVRERVAALQPPAELVEIAGADHSFEGGLPEVQAAVRDFVESWLDHPPLPRKAPS